jgi:hypothetical protein
MQVWRDNHVGYCPAPVGLREKKWSKFLREIWPECTVVNLDDTMKSSTKTPVPELRDGAILRSEATFGSTLTAMSGILNAKILPLCSNFNSEENANEYRDQHTEPQVRQP